jgi:hypothetical protein
MKTIFTVTALLASSLFLGGCMVRMTGPCLGYGCPALSGGTAHASTAAPNANSANTVAAKNAPATNSTVHAGN